MLGGLLSGTIRFLLTLLPLSPALLFLLRLLVGGALCFLLALLSLSLTLVLLLLLLLLLVLLLLLLSSLLLLLLLLLLRVLTGLRACRQDGPQQQCGAGNQRANLLVKRSNCHETHIKHLPMLTNRHTFPLEIEQVACHAVDVQIRPIFGQFLSLKAPISDIR